jgi:predicted aspartyl protease
VLNSNRNAIRLSWLLGRASDRLSKPLEADNRNSQNATHSISILMKKLFAPILLLAVVGFCRAQSLQNSSTLVGFLSRHGLAGAKLERLAGNNLFVPVYINNQRAALVIDTGSPLTIIDMNSVNTFRLTVDKTAANVGGLFGRSWERYGTSKVKSVALGNCTVTNVPVAIADLSNMNRNRNDPVIGSHIPRFSNAAHVNGLLGAREMVKFGMIIDCARQMIYINPNGSSSDVSQSLTSFLVTRGFTRIPMRLTGNHHFDVEGALNGHATRFIVDTGAPNTLIDEQTAVRSETGVAPLIGAGASGAGGMGGRVDRADVRELAIGAFKIANAQVAVAHVSSDVLQSKSATEANAGVLGEEYLSTHFGIIDMGGMTLYLRHPDSR